MLTKVAFEKLIELIASAVHAPPPIKAELPMNVLPVVVKVLALSCERHRGFGYCIAEGAEA